MYRDVVGWDLDGLPYYFTIVNTQDSARWFSCDRIYERFRRKQGETRDRTLSKDQLSDSLTGTIMEV